jgi:hypothetical protein
MTVTVRQASPHWEAASRHLQVLDTTRNNLLLPFILQLIYYSAGTRIANVETPYLGSRKFVYGMIIYNFVAQ